RFCRCSPGAAWSAPTANSRASSAPGTRSGCRRVNGIGTGPGPIPSCRTPRFPWAPPNGPRKSMTETIGFIGLGNMGGPMSGRLPTPGYRVRGSDRAKANRLDLAGKGGIAAESLADAVADAAVVILMLPNSDIVTATVRDDEFEPDEGTIVVDMSSSEPLRT